MAHRKAELSLAVGVLSILSSVFIIIAQELSKAFCDMSDSCVYTPALPLFPIILSLVGVSLTLIGLVCGGVDEDYVKGEQDE